MNNPYQYCTRCGCELNDELKDKYQEEHQGGPVLCVSCWGDVLGQALNPLVEAIVEAYKPVVNAVNDMFNPEQWEDTNE